MKRASIVKEQQCYQLSKWWRALLINTDAKRNKSLQANDTTARKVTREDLLLLALLKEKKQNMISTHNIFLWNRTNQRVVGALGEIRGKALKLHLQELFTTLWAAHVAVIHWKGKGTAFTNFRPSRAKGVIETKAAVDEPAATWGRLQFSHFQANNINPA